MNQKHFSAYCSSVTFTAGRPRSSRLYRSCLVSSPPPRCFQPAPYFIAFKSVPLVNVVTVHNLTSVADCLCVLLYDICRRQALLSETVICQGWVSQFPCFVQPSAWTTSATRLSDSVYPSNLKAPNFKSEPSKAPRLTIRDRKSRPKKSRCVYVI